MEIRSAVLGDVNVNARREYTPQDDQQFSQGLKSLRDNRFDLWTADRQRNLDGLDDYFQRNRQLPVTVENIYRAIEQEKSKYVWLSQAAADWYQAIEQNLQLGNDLANYVASTSGRPGQLVKDGSDLHFENLSTLFKEINSRGESATPQSIANALDRIQHRPGKGRLHFVPQPRRTEPISPAAKADALENPDRKPGQLFSSGDMVRTADGGWRSKTAAEQAADRRAAEETTANTTQQLSKEDARWAAMTQELLGYGSHGQRETLRQVYNQTTGGPRKVYEAVSRVVQMYKRAAAVSGLAGR